MSRNRSYGRHAHVYVTIPGEGTLERTFRNQGEAVGYLKKNYGSDYKKLRARFHNEAPDNFMDQESAEYGSYEGW